MLEPTFASKSYAQLIAVLAPQTMSASAAKVISIEHFQMAVVSVHPTLWICLQLSLTVKYVFQPVIHALPC